jgi:hypothetical protein
MSLDIFSYIAVSAGFEISAISAINWGGTPALDGLCLVQKP